MFTFSNFQFSIYTKLSKTRAFENFVFFYCCIRLLSHLHYLYRFHHSRATHTWSVCNEMYPNVYRYDYVTFQTQIHSHKHYIFDIDTYLSEYAFLFLSVYVVHDWRTPSHFHVKRLKFKVKEKKKHNIYFAFES